MSSGTRPTWASQTCAVSSLPSGKGTVIFTGCAVGSAEQGQRQPVRVIGRVPLRLPAVG